MNRLSQSTSPYLLQHAHNPVDWYEWGPLALARARDENRPIFLSIGYAACHWCHVMAHESFEDESVAALMNEHFVNIKVDREQRPDIDSIYMAATVSLTGSGGWPMSVFLTPELKPFYAGTYFPPEPRYNMPSFRDLLTSIAQAWSQEREDVERISAQISEHIQRQSAWAGGGVSFTQDLLDGAVKHLHESYDYGFGGWGQAPKFPQPMTIEFLLRRATQTLTTEYTKSAEGNKTDSVAKDELALKPALHALRSMARGGMYDVVGGGFSRYSTDNLWRVPHFEKMLYDNAQLARAYLHAYQITGEPFYRRIVEETLGFVMREMTSPEGGFYSSLDADSEGEEGKFYVWTQDEIRATLGPDAEFFEAAYGVHATGNTAASAAHGWEGKTILQRNLDDATLAARFELSTVQVGARLAGCHTRLLDARNRRVRPGTDDKVLTAWNGLMLSAFAEAARVLEPGNPVHSNNPYHNMAIRNANFLLSALRPGGQLRRAWRAGTTSSEVFLDDYAALVNGLLDLYQTDFDPRWFATAQELADEMITRFADPAGSFFDTPSDGESLLLRPKDLQDNAVPSGASLAAEGLLKLAALTDRADYRARAEESFALIVEHALRYPTGFGRWLCAADFALAQVKQVAIIGDPAKRATQALLDEVRAAYRPNMVVAAAPVPLPPGSPALLAERPLVKGKPAAYVCEGFVCKTPVTTADELKNQF